MKYCLLVSVAFLAVQLYAQTPLIAHKSHSGRAAGFSLNSYSNFGKVYIPPTRSKPVVVVEEEKYEYFESLNDSIIIKLTTDSNQDLKSIDTLSNDEKLPLEKFKSEYKKKKETEKQQQRNTETKKVIPANEDGESPSSDNKRQNSPSFLLIFFAVSAVGMIIIRLFRSPQDISGSV